MPKDEARTSGWLHWRKCARIADALMQCRSTKRHIKLEGHSIKRNRRMHNFDRWTDDTGYFFSGIRILTQITHNKPVVSSINHCFNRHLENFKADSNKLRNLITFYRTAFQGYSRSSKVIRSNQRNGIKKVIGLYYLDICGKTWNWLLNYECVSTPKHPIDAALVKLQSLQHSA